MIRTLENLEIDPFPKILRVLDVSYSYCGKGVCADVYNRIVILYVLGVTAKSARCNC